MKILDIHTHHLPPVPGEAILNIPPLKFTPQPGQYYSVGFHPWYLSTDGSEEWAKLNEVITHPQVLAIGETGLDKTVEIDLALQKNAFERQLTTALLVQKPLIIHCVHSYNEIIEFKKLFKPDNPWIIHGFRGKKELAMQLIRSDIYLSFGYHYQKDALLATPLERMFLETDENRTDIHTVYRQVAEHLSLPVNELISSVKQNISNVFFKQ